MVAGRPLLPGRLAGLHSGAALRSMHCAALGLLGCCTSARNGSLVLRRGGFHCLRAWVRASGVACVGPPAGPCAFLESFCPSSPPPLVPSSPPLPSHPPACLSPSHVNHRTAPHLGGSSGCLLLAIITCSLALASRPSRRGDIRAALVQVPI